MSEPFDEKRGLAEGPRPAYGVVKAWLDGLSMEELEAKSREAELLFRRFGITFAVYGEDGDPQRIIPFDVVPRVLSGGEWARLERSLIQRVSASMPFCGTSTTTARSCLPVAYPRI